MRRLIIGSCAAILLTGCSTLEGISTIMNFNDHAIPTRIYAGGATKQDMLAIQQPRRVIAARNGVLECLDYQLENKGKKQDFYVGITDAGRVGAYGFIGCERAIKEGYLDAGKASVR
ncbi:hypothetical protein ACXX81_01200 [Pseudomonas sp. GNP013]|jgi:hypothetical protein|uniref:hypothetical protein n=1 Tax=Pseudomonas sp. Leaf59 TaxID=2876556 RepID=UPI001E40667F|nr:hypothetical protein [Pseudomonas sp. Leaf59]